MAEITPVGAGQVPHPSPPSPDGVLRIRGGHGGIAFQFEELLAGATVLEDLSGRLAAIEREADAVRVGLFPYQQEAYATGSRAIMAVGESCRNVGQVRDQLHRIGDEVRASYREYEYAEARNAINLRLGLGHPWFDLGSGLKALNLFSLHDAAEAGVAQVPLGFWSLLLGPALGRTFTGLSGPTDIKGILRTAASAPGLGHLKPRHVEAQEVTSRVETVDTTPSGLLHRVDALHGDGPGHIEIIRTENNGEPVWLVLIPGTQPTEPIGGSNPLDVAGIVDALGYGSEEVNAAVRQALRDAGAEAGQQVAAIGHSQGGIHAMNLSQDKAFLAEFELKYVLTAGSPVGGIDPEPGIVSLHLDHTQDWVPAMDGVPNPDTKDRTTVTMTNVPRLEEGEDFGLGPGHKLGNYVEGAKLAEASQDPSLLASTAALAGVVGAGGAAKVTRFKLTRDPMPAAAPPVVRENPAAPGPRPGVLPR